MGTLIWIVVAACLGIYLIWLTTKSESPKEVGPSLTDELPAMMKDLQQRLATRDVNEKPFRMDAKPLADRGTILLKNEQVVFDAPIILARSVKTGAQWKSGSRGMRVSPIRGLSFNVGGSRGKMTPTAEFQKDVGWLTLTTKRICFKGKEITFAISVDKVDNISRDDALCFIDLRSRDVPDFHAAFANSSMAQIFTMLYSNPDEDIRLIVEE